MLEYVYHFKYVLDCFIGKDRYRYGSNRDHVYFCVDSSGMNQSCCASFNNLKDVQVHYLMAHHKTVAITDQFS